ncbi:hypothetical protein HYZ41_03310 [archaeon]|nr:hypothetical protein [archaeon]
MDNAFEEKIYSTFSSVASSMGYSEVHGRIISALLVTGKPMSMDDLIKVTKYSAASISLSLDLLEILGIVKKFRQKGDRKIYVRLDGDLIEGLRNAMLLKLRKEIAQTLNEFESMKTDENSKKTIKAIEKEVKRLREYVDRLSEVSLPKK